MKSFKGSRAAQNIFSLLLILATSLTIYSNTFHAPFHGDEEPYIRDNLFTHDISGSLTALRADSELYKTIIQRYVGYLSFALNYRIHGVQVEGYHAVNLVIHILNGMLVYLLVLLTFRTPRLAGSALGGHARAVALFSGLFFVAHPVQTEAVTYIMQRLASLAAFFSLLSLALYIRWRLGGGGQEAAVGERGPAGAPSDGPLWWYAGSVLSAVLAMKTKENAFILPVVIAAYELFFFRGDVKKRMVRLTPLAATLLIIPVTTLVLLSEKGMDLSKMAAGGDNVPLEWVPYLITQLRVLVTYLRLLIAPVNQNFLYDYPRYHSILDPAIVLSLGVHLSLVLAGIALFRRSRQGDPALRIASFGILWFYITLSVESGLIPLPLMLCEYRLYLPSVGVFVAGVTVFSLAMAKIGSRTVRSTGIILASLLLIIAGYAAYQRNVLFNDKVSLWQDTIRKSPSLPNAHNNLGNAYLAAGRLDDAIKEFRIAVGLNPSYIVASYSLAVAVAKQGHREESFKIYTELLHRYPDALLTYYNPAVMTVQDAGAFASTGDRSPGALEDRAESYFRMGGLFERRGRITEALQDYYIAARLAPGHVEAHFSLGNLYTQIEEYDRSIEEYRTAIQLNPDHIGARNNLSGVYVQLGRYQEALHELQYVLERAPGNEDARYNLQVVSDLLAEERARTRY